MNNRALTSPAPLTHSRDRSGVCAAVSLHVYCMCGRKTIGWANLIILFFLHFGIWIKRTGTSYQLYGFFTHFTYLRNRQFWGAARATSALPPRRGGGDTFERFRASHLLGRDHPLAPVHVLPRGGGGLVSGPSSCRKSLLLGVCVWYSSRRRWDSGHAGPRSLTRVCVLKLRGPEAPVPSALVRPRWPRF